MGRHGLCAHEQTGQGPRQSVVEWGRAAAAAFGYPPPGDAWADRVLARLPQGLLASVDQGVRDGLLRLEGHQFRPAGLPPGKGPYSWFSRCRSGAEPAPNWEYFVQVAVWLDLVRSLPGSRVGFEDELMDVAVRRADGRVDWCLEVKERGDQLPALLEQVRRHARGVDPDAPEGGDDGLRKARYVLRHRPRWFSLVGLGARHDFAVVPTGERSFRLEPDVVPLALVGCAA